MRISFLPAATSIALVWQKAISGGIDDGISRCNKAALSFGDILFNGFINQILKCGHYYISSSLLRRTVSVGSYKMAAE